MKILSSFKKIDAPWALEVITERFDFLPIECMTENSIVYGGAVRDTLAGIRLQGDLDIVVGEEDFSSVVEAIEASSKWLMVNGNEPGRATTMVLSGRNPYGKNIPLQEVVRFKNTRGIEIEVVLAERGLSEENSIIEVPSRVDIVCCGLAMDRNGEIYEIVKDAYQDCQDRILRFNRKVLDTVEVDRMVSRIKKLEKRGWKSRIKIAPIRKHRAKKDKEQEIEEAKKRKKSKGEKKWTWSNTYDWHVLSDNDAEPEAVTTVIHSEYEEKKARMSRKMTAARRSKARKADTFAKMYGGDANNDQVTYNAAKIKANRLLDERDRQLKKLAEVQDRIKHMTASKTVRDRAELLNLKKRLDVIAEHVRGIEDERARAEAFVAKLAKKKALPSAYHPAFAGLPKDTEITSIEHPDGTEFRATLPNGERKSVLVPREAVEQTKRIRAKTIRADEGIIELEDVQEDGQPEPPEPWSDETVEEGMDIDDGAFASKAEEMQLNLGRMSRQQKDAIHKATLKHIQAVKAANEALEEDEDEEDW